MANSQSVVLRGGPAGKPEREATINLPLPCEAVDLDAVVFQACGAMGFRISHLEYQKTAMFSLSGEPARGGGFAGTLTVLACEGKFQAHDVVLAPSALPRFAVAVPEEPPAPRAPMTLEEQLADLRARVERLERSR